MSFLKFWGRKTKSKDAKELEYQKELRRENAQSEDEKNKLRHSLSISRSGRFKSKNRERGKILDQPELFNTGSGAPRQDQSNANSQNMSQGHSRSPNNTCRDIRQVAGMGLQTGHNHQQTAVL